MVSVVDSGALVFSRCQYPWSFLVARICALVFSRCQDLCWVSYCPLTTSIPYVASQISCAASVEPMFVLFYRVVLSIVASVCAIITVIPSLSMVVPPESLSGSAVPFSLCVPPESYSV